MIQAQHRIRFRRALMAIGMLYLLMPVPGHSALLSKVNLFPGDRLQDAVNAAAPGTTFLLKPGTYRMQSVAPKDNDVFLGEGEVILTGAQILKFLPLANGQYWAASAKASTLFHGTCDKKHPLCGYTQDLFIDDAVQNPVASRQELKSGSWYFDRTTDMIYLSFDPTGHRVELGMAFDAFHGSARNVTIRHLIVEKYANRAQWGAIECDKGCSAWTVDDVEVRWNHGTGVQLCDDSILKNSWIHHNGQKGIGLKGKSPQAIHNEISWNNYAGFEQSWEAGGSKFWATDGLLVEDNDVHNNLGNGLWTDYSNIHTTYRHNRVANNEGSGIVHEISYDATIIDNTVENNCNSGCNIWLWGSQILIMNSSNVTVRHNTVTVAANSGNGIGIVNQKRDNFATFNIKVEENTITYLGPAGSSGIVDDTHVFTPAGIIFDKNIYRGRSQMDSAWVWLGRMNWQQFQQHGNEMSGRVLSTELGK